MTQASRTIELFGGGAALARALEPSLTPSVVQGWKERGFIPAACHLDVLAAAHRKGLPLSADDLIRWSDAPDTRPLRGMTDDELQQQKADADDQMKQIAAAEQRLWTMIGHLADVAILSLPEHLQPFFETGSVVGCIERTASAQKLQVTQEDLTYETDERRMDAEDAE